MGPKGQVVIPKEIRDELGISPGDEVVFVEDGDSVRVKRAGGMAGLAGKLGGLDLTAELEADHRRELEQDEKLARRR